MDGMLSTAFTALCSVGSAALIGSIVWQKSNVSIRLLRSEVNRLQRVIGIDELTNLHTRRSFDDIATKAMKNKSNSVFFMMIDLDGFKSVNDTHGHSAGDEVLVVVGKRLSAALRDYDCVARLGGDEFAAVLSGDNLSLDEVKSITERLIERINAPIHLRGKKAVVTVGASIGIVEREQNFDFVDSKKMVKFADALMYKVKASGKNSVQMARATKLVKEEKEQQILDECIASLELAIANNPAIANIS